jgi:peptide/nickel transport system substrate-binding protein
MFDTQYVLNNGGFGTPTSINSNFNQHPIPGTGPYMVTDVSEGAYVQFTQNPNYWGANLSQSEVASNPMLDPGHVKNVIIYFKPDDLSRYTDLSNGAAQIALIEQSDWSLVMSNPDKYSYFSMPPWAGACMAVALNTHRYPTNITDVRLAIVHAINYTDMYEKAVLGYASPFVGPEYPAWKDFYDLGGYPLYSYNITLANQYLKEANLTSMPTLTFTEYSPCQMCINAATVVQADLAQIGIRVNIQMLSSYTAYTEAYGAYSWEVQNVNQLGDITLLGANY